MLPEALVHIVFEIKFLPWTVGIRRRFTFVNSCSVAAYGLNFPGGILVPNICFLLQTLTPNFFNMVHCKELIVFLMAGNHLQQPGNALFGTLTLDGSPLGGQDKMSI